MRTLTLIQPQCATGSQARASGFTLIELMIVVVIVAILAAVAYPSYTNYVRETRRAEGMSLLLKAAAEQEKYRYRQNTYADKGKKLGFKEDKPKSEGGYYELSITAATTADYMLTATPQGDQTNDKCGNLTLDQKGEKKPNGCWQ